MSVCISVPAFAGMAQNSRSGFKTSYQVQGLPAQDRRDRPAKNRTGQKGGACDSNVPPQIGGINIHTLSISSIESHTPTQGLGLIGGFETTSRNVTHAGGDIVTTTAKRTTVYFDPIIHKALKLKSIETSKSISELVNQAVREALAEDAEDIAAFEERTNKPLMSFSELVLRLKKDGQI
jgi:hypothetical protein